VGQGPRECVFRHGALCDFVALIEVQQTYSGRENRSPVDA